MTERGIGLELIQRKIAILLFENVNDEILAQEELWAARDKEWNKITGQDKRKVTLETIENENFHSGHRPSLIEKLPRENYPNISVMTYSGKPTGNKIDQATNYNVVTDIEVMCKSDLSESEVDKRIHRTTEAIHQVFVKNENLDGLSFGWEDDPIIQITDIFSRREEKGHGKDWYWQAARIRYALNRHARLTA